MGSCSLGPCSILKILYSYIADNCFLLCVEYQSCILWRNCCLLVPHEASVLMIFVTAYISLLYTSFHFLFRDAYTLADGKIPAVDKVMFSIHTQNSSVMSCCGPVDKTTDSQLWGPRFESPGSGSSDLGQGNLSSLPSPSEKKLESRWSPGCLLISSLLS